MSTTESALASVKKDDGVRPHSISYGNELKHRSPTLIKLRGFGIGLCDVYSKRDIIMCDDSAAWHMRAF